MQPPTGRLAAALAEATAVGIAQDAPSPAHRGTGSLVRQLARHHGLEKLDRLVEPFLDRRVAHLGEAEHGCPGGSFAQRQATGTARQGKAQQVGAAADLALALDRLGLPGNLVEIDRAGKLV
jgi:hypothetical protein